MKVHSYERITWLINFSQMYICIQVTTKSIHEIKNNNQPKSSSLASFFIDNKITISGKHIFIVPTMLRFKSWSNYVYVTNFLAKYTREFLLFNRESSPLTKYLTEVFNLEMKNYRNISITKYGTMIDAVFTRSKISVINFLDS